MKKPPIKLPAYTLLNGSVDSPEALVHALKAAHTHTRDTRKQEAIDLEKRRFFYARHWLRPKRKRGKDQR